MLLLLDITLLEHFGWFAVHGRPSDRVDLCAKKHSLGSLSVKRADLGQVKRLLQVLPQSNHRSVYPV